MDISIVIVNYNVKYFLDQCLRSIYASNTTFSYEIWVVDNNSSDGSTEFIRTHYPKVNLIANEDNRGFAAANNQAIARAKGRYLLLLNPDTIIGRETLEICARYLDKHADTGAVGVRMIDGSGNYLPESKRGTPTPLASFFKMTGLYKLAPSSSTLNKYYMGQVQRDGISEIEVLSGAFMFLRGSVMEEVGYLDDDFFMYGEDIDLSYRIRRAGHRIVYLGNTSIVHFKGESTRKSSLAYHKHFYRAMLIFTKKHFASRNNWGFYRLLRIAIYLKGITAFLVTRLRPLARLFFAAVIIVTSFLIVKWLWTLLYFNDTDYLPASFERVNLPLYSVVLILCLFTAGFNLPKTRTRTVAAALFTGLILLLVIYALLPLQYRNSRMILLLGWSLSSFFILSYSFAEHSVVARGLRRGARTLWVGSRAVFERYEAQNSGMEDLIGYVGTAHEDDRSFLGGTNDLHDVVNAYQPDRIIFERSVFDMDYLMARMTDFGKQSEVRIFSDKSDVIIGSSSKNRPGTIRALNLSYQLQKPAIRQRKRLIDLLLCLFAVLSIPVSTIVHQRPLQFLRNIYAVLIGERTWVGYLTHDPKVGDLPLVRDGVRAHMRTDEVSPEDLHNYNYLYARDYNPWQDIATFMKDYKMLDQE